MPGRLADITIRPAVAEDESFVRLLGSRSFGAYSRDPQRVMGAILADPRSEALVAEIGRTRVGFVVIQFSRLPRDFGPWVTPTVAHLDAIAVRSDAQGRGIGRELLESAEALARERSARSISLATGEKNLRARRLFEGSGFFPLARVDRYYAGGQPAVLMFRPLAP